MNLRSRLSTLIAVRVVVSTLLLILMAPIMGAIALLIRFDTPGSPIYRQRRVGRGDVPFEMLKLRTMVSGAERMGAGMAVNHGDPRITRAGAILRRWSLDELPNLVNVLRGEMSIVGPRPTIQAQVDQYTPEQRRRLEVKPGITGWAQVNQGHVAEVDEVHRKLHYDFYYIKYFSPWLDVLIVFRTIKTVLTGRGAR